MAYEFLSREDKYKCQVVVDKYVGFAKQHGTKDQYRQALDILLPSSHVYEFLEGRLPHPSQTFPKIAEIVEADEKQRINKLIGERRTRLGAKIGQVTTEVKREVYQNSPLELLYNQVINWTHDDDIRRLYEEKSLQRAYDTLAVLATKEKVEKRAHVQKLAEGMVVLKHAFPLAWTIVLEWKDIEEVKELDKNLLFDFMELFPADGLTKILKGYVSSEISPFSVPAQPNGVNGINGTKALTGDGAEDDLPEEEVSPMYPISSEDRLILMSEGLEESSRSMMSQRLMGEYLLYLEEYSNVVETAKKMKEQLGLDRQVSGLDFRNSMDAANVMLATSLIRHQSPRHHTEARSLFDEILKRKPSNSPALIGVGLILEEEEEYEQATDFLAQALKQGAGVKVKAEAAWCKALSHDYESGLKELEQCLEELEQPGADKGLKAEVLYRIGMCMWNLDASKAARKDRNGAYARFLSSLQANLNFAPSYTSLGVYYSDYARDKKRARKCFQKAFELSASEVEAAERLARTFADQGDWHLVEVVSQRVIDSGKVRPPPGSKKKGLSWPFAALGVCQLNNQDYAKSVVSFQAALRIAPNDIHSWIGLGESYHNSGRYIAATRAFEQTQKLQETDDATKPEDTWFSQYMLANVRRELGDYVEAADGYEKVLALKPLEFGVAIALLQTHVEAAWQNIELGVYGRAASSAAEAIKASLSIIEHRSDAFNMWKALGDACSAFTYIEAYHQDFLADNVMRALKYGYESAHYEPLTEIDKVQLEAIGQNQAATVPASAPIHASILAHKRALHCCSNDIHAQAVAWYNLGWAEYRACVCSSPLSPSFPSKDSMRYLKASVRCFKRAIELEAGNSEFWNALGLVTSPLNPKVAQHAFVRSLYLNDKSAKVWTNLGAFYLLQNDTELANEALTRGQSADPDYAHAWLGQGILALMYGDPKEAYGLFTHAFEISDSSSLVTKRLYATSAFDQALQGFSGDIVELLQPLFALRQLKAQAPQDRSSAHLAALFAERVGDHEEPVEVLGKVCEDLESKYESSESAEILAQFAQAKADLARAYLASNSYSEAIETAETSLDLSADGDSAGPDADARRKFRLSAHLTCGLAANYTGDMDKAISMFRTALKESEGNPDTVCILAQVLWAKGGEQERNNARELLLDCVEHHSEHAGAIGLLAVIAMLDDDQDTLAAVADDLHALRTKPDLDAHDKLKAGRLLAAIALLKPEAERDAAETSDATTAVMLSPFQPQGWSQLASLSGDEETGPAEMALLTAIGSVPTRGTLDAEDLSDAFAGTSIPADAQRSVMVAPWLLCGWEALQS